jgi:UDP-glucuronate decarboxylase
MVLSLVSRGSPKESSVSTAEKGNGKTNGKSHRASGKLEALPRPVVVCGGAGFLGLHLCARLLREGQRVICVDNFCTSDVDAIEHLIAHPRFELLHRDITLLSDEEIGAPSAIYNLACAASPVHYQRSPLDTLFTSVRGMDNLLRLARTHGARVFQASTSEIYGHPTIHPQTEKYWGHVNTVGPRACYDEGKRCAETLCFIYRQEYGVAVRIARIFNTYGPGMRLKDGRVVINFIVQALAGQPITVYGDGSQTRSFCYVDDLLDGIVSLMNVANDFSGPVNLGNPTEITVMELAERIIRLTGSRSKIIVEPLPIDDPPRRRPDISLAYEALRWRPQTSLEEGLMMTIRDVERRLQEGDESLLQTPDRSASREARLAGANAV